MNSGDPKESGPRKWWNKGPKKHLKIKCFTTGKFQKLWKRIQAKKNVSCYKYHGKILQYFGITDELLKLLYKFWKGTMQGDKHYVYQKAGR